MKDTLLRFTPCLLVLIASVLAPATPVRAQLSGIRYTVAPRADHLFFDGNSAIDDATMLSGRLGFGFGEYLEFSAVGRYAPTAQTDFSGFSDLGDPSIFLFDQLRKRDLKMLQYGADLKINFSTDNKFVPYVSIGTGVLSLDPDGLDRTETIYLGGSIGLLYRWQDRITVTLEGQRQQWRQNAASLLSDTDLTDVALAREDFRTIGVGAYALGAGISFDLGGRVRGEMTELDRALAGQFSQGFSAVRLEVEPFYARIHFAEALGYREDQRMAGVGAGVDLGPFVGVRGFYWRGMNDGGRVSFDDLQAYGGQLIMRFGTPNRTVRPHLSVGGGYMDVQSGYQGSGVGVLEDRPFALVGAGATIQAGQYFSVQGGVRSLLASAESAESVSSPSSVEASWMYFGGISFELGRGGLGAKGRAEAALVEEPASSVPVRSEPSPRDLELAELRAEVERQRRLVAALLAGTPLADSLQAPAGSMRSGLPESTPATPAAKREWITVPVPEQGEIYIRFGAPSEQPQDAVYYLDTATGQLTPALSGRVSGRDSLQSGISGMTAAEVQAIVNRAVRQATRTQREQLARADSSAELRAFEARMEQRFRELDRKLSQQQALAAVPEDVEAIEPEDQDVTARRAPLRMRALMPVTGMNVNDPRTVLLGGRIEMARETSAYSVLSDLILGFGSATTWSLSTNAVVTMSVTAMEGLDLYLGPGLGFVSDGDAQVVLNLLLGARYPLGTGKVFAEYQSQDLFNNNRILLGYRFGL